MTRTITARRWLRLVFGRRKAIDLAIIAVLLVAIAAGGLVWRATWIGRKLLHNWVVGAIDEGSGGVYQLRIGQVHFDWTIPPGIAVDSLALATRRALNEHRTQPLPGLRLALYRCAIRGVDFFDLVFSRGLIAESFGCESGTLMVQMPRRPRIAPGARVVARAKLDFEERAGLSRNPAGRPVAVVRAAHPHRAGRVSAPRPRRSAAPDCHRGDRARARASRVEHGGRGDRSQRQHRGVSAAVQPQDRAGCEQLRHAPGPRHGGARRPPCEPASPTRPWRSATSRSSRARAGPRSDGGGGTATTSSSSPSAGSPRTGSISAPCSSAKGYGRGASKWTRSGSI